MPGGPIGNLMKAMHRPVYRSRLRVLTARILPHLHPGDRVLDVGCGNGTLGRALMDSPACPKGVQVEGLERVVRGGEPITVHGYDGVTIPFPDGTFDVVIVADVLHHEPNPDRLMSECARVSRRAVIIKDHQVKGLLAQSRISFIDWAANAPYGVPCLYRYNTPKQWKAVPGSLGLEVAEEAVSMKLYPWYLNFFFGGALQYFLVMTRRA